MLEAVANGCSQLKCVTWYLIILYYSAIKDVYFGGLTSTSDSMCCRVLNITDCREVTTAGVAALANCKLLHNLNISYLHKVCLYVLYIEFVN